MASTQAADEASAMMMTALDSLKQLRRDSANGGAEDACVRAVVQAAEHVKGQASKMALLWKNSKTISTKDSEALVAALANSVVSFCSSCDRLCRGKGQALHRATCAAASPVVAGCLQLSDGLLVKGTCGEAVLDLVKPVIAHCDAVGDLPGNDRDALLLLLRKAIASVTSAARDARTLQEEIAATQVNGHADEGPGESDDSDVAWPSLSPAEAATALAAGDALQCVADLLNDGAAALQQGPPLGASEMEEWDSIVLFHCPQLDRGATDLTAGLYPPQSQAEVVGDLESLLNTVQLVLDEMPLGQGSETDRNAMRDRVTSSFGSLREAALQLEVL